MFNKFRWPSSISHLYVLSKIKMHWLSRLSQNTNIKKTLVLTVAIGTIAFSAVFFGRIAYLAISESFWINLGEKHFAAVVGLPAAALAAFILVLVLETTLGEMEFKVLGFEFRGSSGPVVLWVFSFLAISFSIWLLWDKTYIPIEPNTNIANQSE